MTLTLALVAGLTYAQLCDTSCAFYGCAPIKQAKVVEQPEPSGHCHKTESEPSPADEGNLPVCETHADATALLPSNLTSVAALHQHGQMPVVELPPSFFIYSIMTPGRAAGASPFRSPPKVTTVAVLRI